MKYLSTLLTVLLVTPPSGAEEVKLTSEDLKDATVLHIAAERVTPIQHYIDRQEDADSYGNVILLSNGFLVLEQVVTVNIEDSGVVQLPIHDTALKLLNRKQVESQSVQVIAKYLDVSFSIAWNDTSASVVLQHADGTVMMFGVEPLDSDDANATGPTCAADCSQGSCSATCPPKKACLAYCDGSTPVCKCITIPKNFDYEYQDDPIELP